MSQAIDDLLRMFLDQTREQCVVLLDPAGRITAWLGSAEHMFGYTASETVGQPVSMLFTPENLQAGMDKWELEVARTDIEAEDDRWMLRKDGSRFWAAGTLTPIKDAGGRIVGFVKILRDRSDMRAKEETLANKNEDLQQADERKNQFIARLAHELRNPLSSISNAATLLKVPGLAEEDQILVVSTIESGLSSMLRMVNDLLEITRAGAGKIKLNKHGQPLEPIIRSSVDTCRPAMDDERQKLHVILPETPIIVDVDSDRMQQVFVNLIQNAARATKNGGSVWVKLSLEGDEAVFKVEDDGVGISPELLPRIFDMFTQAEFASDRHDAGLGIGLSVVKDLTTLHGGTVQVRSEGIGKGSEFTVRLPLANDGAK